MSQRLNFFKQSPTLSKKFIDLSMAMKHSVIEQSVRDLVNLRASQLNGCGFCLDMHVKEAKIHGERELRMHHVAIWRESPLFDARERAALAWTEALTRLPEHGISDALYEQARSQFSEQELADLSFAVVMINGWNRLNIGFQPVPGSMDADFGLTKAGLS